MTTIDEALANAINKVITVGNSISPQVTQETLDAVRNYGFLNLASSLIGIFAGAIMVYIGYRMLSHPKIWLKQSDYNNYMNKRNSSRYDAEKPETGVPPVEPWTDGCWNLVAWSGSALWVTGIGTILVCMFNHWGLFSKEVWNALLYPLGYIAMRFF